MKGFLDRDRVKIENAEVAMGNPKERRGSRKAVLIVDDVASNRGLARGILEEAGYEVAEAAHGHSALEAIKKRPFGVILMDLCMPYCDGPSAVRAMRAMDTRLALVPIIAVTAETDPVVLTTLDGTGFDDCLAIPYARDVILEKVEHWLSVGDWSAPRNGGPAWTAGASIDLSSNPIDEVGALPLLNQAHLDVLTDAMDAAEKKDLALAFRSRTSTIVALLEDGWDKASDETRRENAHAVRSSAQTLGATRLSALALRMEFGQGADQGKLEVFRATLEATQKALESWSANGDIADNVMGAVLPVEDLVDPRRLDEVLALPPASLRSITSHLRADVERHAGLIEQGWLTADLEAMQRGSHTLKSVAGSLGAVPLEVACSRLHVACRSGDRTDAVALARPVYPLAMATVDRLHDLLDQAIGEGSDHV